MEREEGSREGLLRMGKTVLCLKAHGKEPEGGGGRERVYDREKEKQQRKWDQGGR